MEDFHAVRVPDSGTRHNGSSIGIYNIPARRLIACGNLGNQCYRNYFYGKQPTIEHALGGLESAAAAVIRGCLAREIAPPPVSAEHIVLSHFVVLQAARTAYEAEAEAESTDKVFKTIYRDQFGSLDAYEIGFDDPVLLSLRVASRWVPAAYDLRIKLLTEVGFITSDNPVVRHNQYYEGNAYFGHTGWAQADLQVFLPLSPKYLCLFYDAGTYRVGPKGGSVVGLHAVQDVHALNALQCLNALENLYFAPGESPSALAQALQAIPRRRAEKASVMEHPLMRSRKEDDPPGSERTLLHEFRPGLNVRLKVSSIKLRRRPAHPRFDNRAAPARDDAYLRIVEEFGTLMAHKGARPDEFLSFAAKRGYAQNRASAPR